MLCPRDEEELEPYAALGLQIRVCPRCAGILLARALFDRSDELLKAGAISALRIKGSLIADEDIRCPLDAHPMTRRKIKGVQFDICGACQSVWLDGGELRLLADRRAPKDTAVVSDSMLPDMLIESAVQALINLIAD